MSDPFSILSRELSKAERKLMLARILSSSARRGVEEESLEEILESPPLSVGEEYSHFPLLRKLVLLLRSFFTHRSVHELTEDFLLKRIQADIQAAAPGLMDFRNGRFTTKMKTEIEALKPAMVYLRSVLHGIPRQKDFIAFLAGIELDPLNEQILRETDPHAISEDPLITEEREVRQEMWARFERIVDDIPKERRESVHLDVQRLQACETLCSTRMEESIALFPQNAPEDDGGSPNLHELGSKLMQICDSIQVIRTPPSSAAWNALFLYRASDALEDPDFELEKQAAAFLLRVSTAMKSVGGFAHRIPIVDILRFILRDLSFSPKGLKGGEEWFALFKSFWEDHLETILRRFAVERRKRECVTEAAALVGASELPYFENYRTGRYGRFTARYETSLAFARVFYESVFQPKMERYLKLVHINGDFYKEENREVFTDCYEKVIAAYEKARALDGRLAPGGDLGKRLTNAQAEKTAPEVMDKIRFAMEEANVEARRISDQMYTTLGQLSRILFGILFGEAGSPYDSITNLNTIGGRENKSLLKGLEEAMGLIDRASALLAQIRDVEIG